MRAYGVEPAGRTGRFSVPGRLLMILLPVVDGGWLFWQYTDRKRLEGYEGTEKYIDMNVFCGSGEELEQILVPAAADWTVPGSNISLFPDIQIR